MDSYYWNANYWFRRVGDSILVNKISSVVTQQCNVHSFAPAEFTTQIESWNRSKDSTELAELGRIATQEWEALWAML
jgi:hypothetical protein